MQRAFVHFDLCTDAGVVECLAQHDLGMRLFLVVILGNGDQEACLHLRYQEVRTVFPVRRQATAVERTAGTDPVRIDRRVCIEVFHERLTVSDARFG